MTKRILLTSCALFVLLLPSVPAPVHAQDMAYPNMAANMEVRLAALEDQIRMLTGKVEQYDFIARRMDQALQRMQADYDARLMHLETAQAQAQAMAQQQPPAAAPQHAPPAASAGAPSANESDEDADAAGQQPAVTGSLGGMKLRGNKVTDAVVNPKQPPLPKTPEDYGLTPQEQYDKAFGLLRQASYDDAEKAFKNYIDKNGNDKMVDNAKYWYGETFYVRGKFNDAAIAFADAFQQNPKGSKAPDSLLKLALSLGAVDKKTDACGALDALRAKYPNASATIKARTDQERSRLKCK